MFPDFELFQSGQWEHALFLALCERLVQFPVILPGGSSPDLVSSYACADRYFSKFSRGPLHSGVICAVLSSVVLCPMDSCQSGLSELSSLSFQLRDCAGLWLTLVPRLDLENSLKGSLHLFPISQRSLSSAAWYPENWKSFSHIFCHFCFVLFWTGKLIWSLSLHLGWKWKAPMLNFCCHLAWPSTWQGLTSYDFAYFRKKSNKTAKDKGLSLVSLFTRFSPLHHSLSM